MSLRHALLVSLADREASGYDLARQFRASVANYWQATSQQIYRELERMSGEGWVRSREVVQQSRPNKRLYAVTAAGREALAEFTRAQPKPMALRDELMIQVEAVDHGDPAGVLEALERRIADSEEKLARHRERLEKLTGGLGEREYLARGRRIGAYLTLSRGVAFEEQTLRWARWAAEAVRAGVAGPEAAGAEDAEHDDAAGSSGCRDRLGA